MAKRKAAFYIFGSAIIAAYLYSAKVHSKSTSFIVITNATTPSDSISASDLREIYNGDRVFWKSGKRIRAARLSDDSGTNTEFFAVILGKSATQYVQHWRHKLFSGKGLPPKVIEDSDKMIVYIEENEASIGFIPATKSFNGSKIKVLEVTE